jgi:uncharacterized protein YggE
MRIVQIGAIAAVVALAAAFAGVGRPEPARGSSPDVRSVSVTGTAGVQAVPNRAGLEVSVSSDAATAKAAVAANAGKSARVVGALRAAGVASQDLQTDNVSVSPRWNDRGQQDGFTATNSVQVKVRDVAKTGAILDAAVGAGATETSGPSFDQGNREELYRGALRAAFDDARAKASVLAGEAGASLGPVLRIEESQAAPPVILPAYGAAERAPTATPVEPGTQNVQATVSVTFSLS